MEDNCDSEVYKLQKQFDAILSKLDEIKKRFEIKLREHLIKKTFKVDEKKKNLEKKCEKIKDLVKFLEKKHSNISDYSLIDNNIRQDEYNSNSTITWHQNITQPMQINTWMNMINEWMKSYYHTTIK